MTSLGTRYHAHLSINSMACPKCTKHGTAAIAKKHVLKCRSCGHRWLRPIPEPVPALEWHQRSVSRYSIPGDGYRRSTGINEED